MSLQLSDFSIIVEKNQLLRRTHAVNDQNIPLTGRNISHNPGLFIGCLLSNLLTGCMPLDVVFGSLATLIGACGTYALRKHKWLAPLPPIVANTIIVPFVLAYVYMAEGTIPFFMLTVGIGEVISCYVLGMILYKVLNNYRSVIFKNED